MSITEYVGTITQVNNSYVAAEVSVRGDIDTFETFVPIDSFSERIPNVGDDFRCQVILHEDNDYSVISEVIDPRSVTLKDFGIDEEELLEWASKIDL